MHTINMNSTLSQERNIRLSKGDMGSRRDSFSAVRSCERLMSARSSQGLSSLPRSQTSLNRSRRSERFTGTCGLPDIMTELNIPKTSEMRETSGNLELAKFRSSMPMLKPERKRSSDTLLGAKKGTKNAVFENAAAYNKKPNMFEQFQMSPTSVMSMPNPSKGDATMERPMMYPSMDMKSLHNMLPLPCGGDSPPMALRKPTRKASMDMAFSSGEALFGPRRVKPIDNSNNTFDVPSPTMPLRKPMRKASMDTQCH